MVLVLLLKRFVLDRTEGIEEEEESWRALRNVGRIEH